MWVVIFLEEGSGSAAGSWSVKIQRKMGSVLSMGELWFLNTKDTNRTNLF